jgi:hypothetical protein
MTSINIQNSGAGAYLIDSVGNGVISLIRGNTYYLVINAGGHPFWIQTVPGGYSSNNIYSSGVTNNGTQNGTITFIVPSDAPNTLYYVCQYHSSMQGQMNITNLLSPTITNFSIPNQIYSNGRNFTITPPSSTSPGAFSYTSSDTNIATISGSSTVIILQSGFITITATQAATTNYASGSTTASFIISTDTPSPRISMGSLYTNNAQVFYKPNSLAPGGIGSVRNNRLKSRKT